MKRSKTNMNNKIKNQLNIEKMKKKLLFIKHIINELALLNFNIKSSEVTQFFDTKLILYKKNLTKLTQYIFNNVISENINNINTLNTSSPPQTHMPQNIKSIMTIDIFVQHIIKEISSNVNIETSALNTKLIYKIHSNKLIQYTLNKGIPTNINNIKSLYNSSPPQILKPISSIENINVKTFYKRFYLMQLMLLTIYFSK